MNSLPLRMSRLSMLLFVAFLSQTAVLAQVGWMPGVGPSIAPSSSLAGINTRVYYGVNERFCFGPEISFFPYQQLNNEYDTQLWEANVNAHYVFEVAHRLGLYPLSGFNYSFENERSLVNSNEIAKHNAPGLNYGVGLHYSINNIIVFTEYKGVVSELSDEFFTLGAVILLTKPKPKDHHQD